MKKVFFKTFGCRTNIYDTEVMAASLGEFKRTTSEADADVVVVNSCTVTNGADTGTRSYINQQQKRQKQVILAGCGALSKGGELFEKGKVFGVLGHSERENLGKLLRRDTPFFEQGNLASIDNQIVSEYEGKTKAFVKIQEGCDFRCSYCIIPLVRGNARSQEEARIVEQVQTLAQNGYTEVVLTGTNIGSYGKDKGSSLGKLLMRLGVIDGIRRIRLGSIEPVQIDASFREILSEPWLERHLHVALQHTSPAMLKRMRRRNRVEEDLALFWELRERGFALGTDFITGHPGEDEATWQEAWRILQQFPLTHIHAFTYSKRDGTPSSHMKPEVSGNVAKARLKDVVALVTEKNTAFRQSNAKVPLDVLVEDAQGEFLFGYDQFYNKVKIPTSFDKRKAWVRIDAYTIKEAYNEATP
jgi:MiaB-like tRNA modifying enzyme